ncbi:uncharacterized protein LOC129592852 [Paramacrobiotus metropolitanus]|uniref:uncharacterized protein LOC129592852 n=1 Tax=Paramacrobiotus metropolitanus TaxID=2943436 RepID=UPI002445DBC3|nr:uncharacterized protein LOC129592852 [Paramacrobiotus metropolitanus]XP_055344963.1 uncharacterized protein LOC129592852 [Paramacrobiotus metropolitanus]
MPNARQIGDLPQARRIFHAKQDLLLLDEVNNENPFFAENEGAVWVEIVETLNKVPIFPSPLDVRACKKRLDLLVIEFRKENWRQVVKSGSEEEYGTIQELLTKIVQAIDSAQEKTREKAQKKAEEKKRKEAALKMVDAEIAKESDSTFAGNGNSDRALPTDEELVKIGAMDPSELARHSDDGWESDSEGGKRAATKKLKRGRIDESDSLVQYLKASDVEKQKIREIELKNERDLKELELLNQKELKEKEIDNNFKLRQQELELERYRIELEGNDGMRIKRRNWLRVKNLI